MGLHRRLHGWLVPLGLVVALLPAAVGAAGNAASPDADAAALFTRMGQAATQRSYHGTLVFTTGGAVSTTQVAHYCVGDDVYERLEALDGRQRQVYRHNEVVHTIWPQARRVVVERRWLQLSLPSATQAVEPRALAMYEPRIEGMDRVAGREATVLLLVPRDGWRFAQRIWTDRASGLMLRADVLNASQAVLESSAFTNVAVDVAPQPDTVLQPMRRLDGLAVAQSTATPVQLEAEGWSVARPVPGFRVLGCARRVIGGSGDRPPAQVVQAILGDGLIYVSLFIEAYDAARHRTGLQAQFGATHSLAMRRGDHWITAMGDVPPPTLRAIVDGLERRP